MTQRLNPANLPWLKVQKAQNKPAWLKVQTQERYKPDELLLVSFNKKYGLSQLGLDIGFQFTGKVGMYVYHPLNWSTWIGKTPREADKYIARLPKDAKQVLSILAERSQDIVPGMVPFLNVSPYGGQSHV